MSNHTWSKLMNAVIDDGHLANMRGVAPKVYMALLRHSNFNLKDVHPGIDRLCELTGVKSRSSIKEALKNLADLKLISITHRSNNSRGKLTNLYSFTKFNTLGDGRESDRGEGSESGPGERRENSQGKGGKMAPNKTELTKPTTTTPLKRTTIVHEYESQNFELEDAVVAILKNLKIDRSFWPTLNGMETNRVQALASLASKKAKKNPGGWFRRAVEGDWSIPGFDQSVFEIECDLIRKTSRFLKSKRTGKEYEIDISKTGPKIVIDTDDRGAVVLDTDEALAKFTRVA